MVQFRIIIIIRTTTTKTVSILAKSSSAALKNYQEIQTCLGFIMI